MLLPFNKVSHVVVNPPIIKLFSLLLHTSNFATVMNRSVNRCVFGVLGNPCDPQVENRLLV